jgi:hypothetical protein
MLQRARDDNVYGSISTPVIPDSAQHEAKRNAAPLVRDPQTYFNSCGDIACRQPTQDDIAAS